MGGEAAEPGDGHEVADVVGDEAVEQGLWVGHRGSDDVGGDGRGPVGELTGCVAESHEGRQGDGDADDGLVPQPTGLAVEEGVGQQVGSGLVDGPRIIGRGAGGQSR
ncbi:hypothetical protein ACHMWU_02705 [Aeromicrobium sp. UC242_57]